MTRNCHRGLPVRTSNAWTLPGAASLPVGESAPSGDVEDTPTMTTSRHTCGTPAHEYLVASGPRPAFRLTRPLSPNVEIVSPVLGSSAITYSPRTTKIRFSSPWLQSATPRLTPPPNPWFGSSANGCWTHSVLPVPGWNASTRPTPLGV